jgi:hypothetical protein
MLRDVVVDVALTDRFAGFQPRFIDAHDFVAGVVPSTTPLTAMHMHVLSKATQNSEKA